MPIVDIAAVPLNQRMDTPSGFTVTPGQADIDHGSERPDWSSVFEASFRQDNDIVNVLSSGGQPNPRTKEDGFNPWAAIKGTSYEPHFESFVDVHNSAALEYRKRKIDQEQEDRKLLESAPWWQSVPASIIAGVASPTTFLPAGAIVRGARGGVSISRTALNAGLAAGGATGLQEGVLQGVQETRPLSDSAVNIGASVLLGGLLGAGGAKLLSRAEWNGAVSAIERGLAGGSAPAAVAAKPVYEDVFSKLTAAGVSEPEARANAAVVAARYATRADRLGDGASAVDLYRSEGISVRRAEAPESLVEGLGLTPDDIAARTFNQDEVVAAIRAYHGSPHDFDRFDLSKIGTGEGAQAYGYGLYFAENEGVAKSYRDALKLQDEYLLNGSPAGIDAQDILKLTKKGKSLSEAKEEVAASLRLARDTFYKDNPINQQAIEDRLRSLEAIDLGNLKLIEHPGRMYEVDINGHPDHFLDWDKPITQQAIADRAIAAIPSAMRKPFESIAADGRMTGERFYRQFLPDQRQGENMVVLTPSPLAATERLKAAGIPGIKYLDQGSRNKWLLDGGTPPPGDYVAQAASDALGAHGSVEAAIKALGAHPGYRNTNKDAANLLRSGRFTQVPGTSNFVVFDDRLVDIVRKYQLSEKGAPLGQATLTEAKAIITLFSKANESTFMHEAGHLWLDEMLRDAGKNAGIKSDMDAVLKWLGATDGKIETRHHEQWARGFEEYLRDGKAPSDILAKAFASFKNWLTTIYRALADLGPDHVAIPDDIRSVMDRMLATDAEIAGRGAGGSAPGSLSAAANMPVDIAGNTIAGRIAGAVAAKTAWLNPALRLNTSASPVARQIGGQLFENSVYLNKNFENVASDVAVETLMKEWNSGLAKAVTATDDAFTSYVKDAGGGKVAQAFPSRYGLMTRQEFREEVGRTMRRGDTHDNPFIDKVAKEWRSKVFDPLKKAAIEAGLLPKDVSVETAASYFSRMWNQNKLIAREGEFKQIVRDWVGRNAPRWAEVFDKQAERRLEPLRRGIDDLEMAKLRRAEEARMRDEGGEIEAGDFNESDIRQALRIVAGGAPRPKGVKTLTQFIVEQGGLFDVGGELAHMGISAKARPGLVRKEMRRIGPQNKMQGGGWSFEDMAQKAWEDGFFPDHVSAPTEREFLDALSDDFNKRVPILRIEDRGAYRLTDLVERLEQDLARIGVHDGDRLRFATSDEVKGVVARVYQALDAEADQKIANLRQKLAEREASIGQERDSRFLGDPNEMGHEIANEVFDSLTGKTTDAVRPELITIKARGPLKERTFNIPDELVEDFLENDVSRVGARYTRVMGADVELAHKFGSPDMVEQIQKLRDNYRELRTGFTDEKALKALGDAEKSDVTDLTALRDMLRGTRHESPIERNYAKIVRSANYLNYIRSMGEVVLASLTDAVRPAMVHGLGQYMTTVPQLITNMKGIKLSIAEAQLAGNVAERSLGHRLATLAEITDPYATRGPGEAFLENMTNIGSKWNGIRLWTDWMKSVAAVMTQDRIIKSASDFASIKPKERAYLAYLGIDESMAERIATQFGTHGETVDGVRVANTEQWSDPVAVRTYRAAMNKDVDSIIVQKSIADVPLFASTPTGKALLQFKSFALASHQKVLLRGLQEDQTRFIGGTIAMTAIGMFITWAKGMTGNRPEVQQKAMNNPGWWIAEGFDRAGILAVPMEMANTFERFSGVNPIKAPLKAFDQTNGVSQKMQNRNEVGSLLGPAAGMAQDLMMAGTIPKRMAEGGEATKGQKNSVERLVPFNSYPGLRQMIRYLVNAPD